MIFKKNILHIIEEQITLKTTATKPIVDAINNRFKISFYYDGPRKPKKDSVLPGNRYFVEPVAIGLSKKGNLIIRAWVDPSSGSRSKKGFGKTSWRTFMVSRMRNLKVTDQVFNTKRPDYKEGNDGLMSVTYVTTNWSKRPEIKKSVKKPEPIKTKLPEPPKTKPESPKPDTSDKEKELYNLKRDEWIKKQKEIGGNIKPGQGTRERFKKEVEKELPQPKPTTKPDSPEQKTEPELKKIELPEPTPTKKPPENPEDKENIELQENLIRIKALMYF